jgi:hypothetical protein
VALNSELLNNGKLANLRGHTVPQPFRSRSAALTPKTKKSRIAARPFRFLVEPWGIEPQTSRVRFWTGREISRRYPVDTFPPRDSPSKISGNVCGEAGHAHRGILSSWALTFAPHFSLRDQLAAVAALATLATPPTSQPGQPAQLSRSSAPASDVPRAINVSFRELTFA